MIKTENSTFFISTGIGKVKLVNEIFFAIGRDSPVGQNLIGKGIGDEIKVGINLYKIVSII